MLLRLAWLPAAALLAGSVAAAEELDARTYSPTPVGTTVVFADGGTSEGAFILDPSLGIEDVQADCRSGTWARPMSSTWRDGRRAWWRPFLTRGEI